MISVKEAVAKATDFARAVLEEDRARNIRLEEIGLEQSPPDQSPPRWVVTLSMTSLSPVGAGVSVNREYKMFAVDANTGDVLWMKIRELAGTV